MYSASAELEQVLKADFPATRISDSAGHSGNRGENLLGSLA